MIGRYAILRIDGRWFVLDHALPLPDGSPRRLGRVSHGWATKSEARSWMKMAERYENEQWDDES